MKNKFTKVLGTALTLAVLAGTAVPLVPASALTTPVITVTPTTISNNATYDIRFTTTAQLTRNGTITITFPSDTGVLDSNVTWNCTIAASPGWIGGLWSDANVTGLQFTGDTAARTVIIGLNSTGNQIGEGAQVRVVLGSSVIRNPSRAGNYTLTVDTSNDTAVTSNVPPITLPRTGGWLSGIVTGKNREGQILTQAITHNINAVIDVPGVTTVEVGSGTYNVMTIFPKANQTIVAKGPVGTVILISETTNLPAVSIMADNVTLDGFTINASASGMGNGVEVTGNNSIIRNVTFNNGVNQLSVAQNADTRITIENCIFNVTGNGTGISTGGSLTLVGSIFTGTANTGSGIYVTAGTSTISSSNFNTMGNDVLAVSGNATLKVTKSTITGSGLIAASENSGVITAYGGSLILADNIIRNSSPANYALHISGGNVTACFNTITHNALNVRQTGGVVNVTHNWWGSFTGLTVASLNGTVPYMPFLKAPVIGGRLALNTDNLERTSPVGVEVTCTNATAGNPLAVGSIGAALYTSTPAAVAPPGSPIAYYDVFVSPPASGSMITVKFYNQVFADYSRLYFVGPTGNWSEAGTQGVNATGGYAYVTLTDASTPAVKDLSGTVFVLTTVNPPPVVNTSAALFANTSANLRGNLISMGNSNSVNVSFEYGTTTAYGNITIPVTMTAPGPFNVDINGLLPNTTYHYRARADVSFGTIFGTDMTFITTGGQVPSTVIQVTPPPITGPTPPRFNLTINTSGLGVATGAGTYEGGALVTISATPSQGWQFVNWTGDAVYSTGSANTTVTMTGTKSITAHFELIPPAPDNATSPNTSGNAPQLTPPYNWGLWPLLALNVVVALLVLIMFVKHRRN